MGSSTRFGKRGVPSQRGGSSDLRRLTIGWQHFAEEAQRALALEEVNRGDETRKVCPGVDMQPALAAQVFQQHAIDDTEFQAEFVAHLVAPLHLQRGRADNQYLAGAV